jgi:hypothetical protein
VDTKWRNSKNKTTYAEHTDTGVKKGRKPKAKPKVNKFLVKI